VDAGIGVMAWSPLAGGFLSGKYTRAKPKGESGDRLGGFDFLPYDRERGYALIDLLAATGAKHGASPAQVSIAWLLTRAGGVVRADRRLEREAAAGQPRCGGGEAHGRRSLGTRRRDQADAPYPNWFTDRVADGKVYAALGIPLAVPPVR
jgi:hypothetical protein